MVIDLFWVGIGLIFLGYFIGEGLKNFKNPDFNKKRDVLVREKYLHKYIDLTAKETKEFLNKHPNAPKIELDGVVYYPYYKFIDFMFSDEVYKQ